MVEEIPAVFLRQADVVDAAVLAELRAASLLEMGLLRPSGAASRSGRDTELLHVIRIHGHGVHDGLVLVILLADIDLLALLGGAAGIQKETFR